MTYGRAIAAQLKAQQDVMRANFQQEKESLLNAFKAIQLRQDKACHNCTLANSILCTEDCFWYQVKIILKGVLHEI